MTAGPDPQESGEVVPGTGGTLCRVEEQLPDGRRLTRYQRDGVAVTAAGLAAVSR